MSQPALNLEHEGRISTLEANVKHLQTSMDKLITEVCSIRKAMWVLCLILVASGIELKPILKVFGV
jgi:hypothetical protein